MRKDFEENFSGLVDYLSMYMYSAYCGHPASTVKLTPPAIDTCDGALARHNVLDM